MANATISVNKETVKSFLETSNKKPFLIPEYQRPYAWTEDEIITLFDDIRDFTENEVKQEQQKGEKDYHEGTYFLGTVVSYINENNEQEIIDGQQRITSLLLFLRAIYTKLNNIGDKTSSVKNFISQIEPTIWRRDKLTNDVDYSKILITSKVITDSVNEIFRSILETGIADDNANDNYSVNYRLFQKLYDDLSQNNPHIIYHFIHSLLNCAIVLPIQADTQDTALTIFSTLNDRGMPLSDADIFKAKMYDAFDVREKNKFIEEWKDLDSRSSDANESVQHLFYYYMFYLRAYENDGSTTTPGVRKYFAQNKFSRLKNQNIMEELNKILDLWVVVNQHIEIENENWSSNLEIIKILDMLSSFPNEWWKYPVVIYYLTYSKLKTFEHDFLLFLRKLCVEIEQRYILTPTINAVKPAIIKLNINITKSPYPTFDFKPIEDEQLLETNIKFPHNKNTTRMILKVLAYCNKEQQEPLPDKWEIEHILPQHWQPNYFCDGYSNDKLNELINYIGNLVPLEKKLNIVAGDGYFEKKKQQYAASNIAIANSLTELKSWDPERIIERNVKLVEAIRTQFKLWSEDYENRKPTN